MKYIPNEVKKLTEIFDKAGHEIYMVGGCVRDMVMNIEPSDFDLATSARPEETKEILKGFKTVDTGIRHGTVTVYMNGASFEITTYRIESEYSDGRHPDAVDFTGNLAEDLARRDFTINAMAMDSDGKIIDCFGGIRDIEQRIIRTVGNPKHRFQEDALRILRALRFSAKLGFEIEEETRLAIVSNRGLLENISRERIFAELSKLIISKYASKTFREFYMVIGEAILGENETCCKENFRKASDFLDEIYGKIDGEDIRFAALLKIGKAKPLDVILKNLKVSKAFLKAVLDICDCCDMLMELQGTEEECFSLALIKYKRDTVIKANLLMNFCKTGLVSEKAWQDIDEVKRLKESRCFDIKDLAICGRDLKAMGISGVDIGKALDDILEEVALGRLANNRDELLEFAGKINK